MSAVRWMTRRAEKRWVSSTVESTLSSTRSGTERRGPFRRAEPTLRRHGCMAKFKLDPDALPTLAAAEAARLDAMSDDEITAAALADPDNPPLDAEELGRIAAAREVRAVRTRSGLTQAEFARAFHINVARLRDLEQARTRADSVILAYLKVIDEAPDVVRHALRKAS